MNKDKDTIGKDLRRDFAKVSEKDKEKYQKELLTEFFDILVQGVEQSIFDKYEEIVGFPTNGEELKRNIAKAEMTGKTPAAIAFPAQPDSPFKLSFIPTPDFLNKIDSYVSLHEICKKNDVDLLMSCQPKDNGCMFSAVIILELEYGELAKRDSRMAGNYPSHLIQDIRTNSAMEPNVIGEPVKFKIKSKENNRGG